MTIPTDQTRDRNAQPWARKDDGFPVDRAFLRDLAAEIEQQALAREERFRNYLTWLGLRWALIGILVLALLSIVGAFVSGFREWGIGGFFSR